ncbi:MAG: GntR family transcriptional regulator [Xanthobacteraceae bacterium]|jgi:DNA-binding GntR family transcriptional regulator
MHDVTASSPIRKAHAPLRHQVLDYLREGIIAGRLAPGSRLVERELIEMLGVSRTVIREALRQLETEGLVAAVANKGPVVRELTSVEANDLYAIRGVLIGLAARLFVQNADPTAMEKLRAALDETVRGYRAADPALVFEAKSRFYDILVEGAASESLSTMLALLHARIARWRALGLSHPKRSPARARESIVGLRAMFAAIKNRDATAADNLAREETAHAATEVIQLLKSAERSS